MPQRIAEPSGSKPHTSTPISLPRDSLSAALPSRLQAWGNVPHLSTPCLPGTALSLALCFSVTGIWPASCPGACQPCNLGAGERPSFCLGVRATCGCSLSLEGCWAGWD